MSYFFLFWVVFWCIQGVEVEFITPNSTSAPCIYQKTTQIGKKCGILKENKFQNEIFKKKFTKQNIGVTCVAPVSASVEAYRVVGGCLSMSQFFGKTSYLNIFSLIFGNSYQ